jgi:hypothetical protein
VKVETPAQQLLFTTTLIQSASTSGTGFVFNALSGGDTYPVLVTNKHVAMAPGPGSFSMFPAAGDGQPLLGERVNFTHHDLASLWVGHPNADVDLAAMLVGPFVNLSAQQGKPVFFRAVGADVCPSDEVVEDLDAIEPITFIGYPNALYDKVNLTPIARRGHTATPVHLDYNGLPSFLIDASVFPGSSGSPVFIVQDGGYRSKGSYMLGASRMLFVGAVAAVHVQADSGKLITGATPSMSFNQMLDLGIVFNWRAVIETIETLFSARGLKYGAPAPPADPAAIDISQDEEPPARPQT